MKIKEFERVKAIEMLLSALKEGEDSAKEKGWISSEDVEQALGLRASEDEKNFQFDSIMEKGLMQAKADDSRPAKDVFADLRKRV